jgi:hypothetical protein
LAKKLVVFVTTDNSGATSTLLFDVEATLSGIFIGAWVDLALLGVDKVESDITDREIVLCKSTRRVMEAEAVSVKLCRP